MKLNLVNEEIKAADTDIKSAKYGIRGKIYKQYINVKGIRADLYEALETKKDDPKHGSY